MGPVEKAQRERFLVIQARIQLDLANWDRHATDGYVQGLKRCRRAVQAAYQIKACASRAAPNYDSTLREANSIRATAFSTKASIFIGMSRFTDAVHALQRTMHFCPNPASAFLLASCYKRLGDPRSAIPIYSSILESKQSAIQFATYIQLGKSLSCVGQHALAVQCYQDARKRFPNEVDESQVWHFHMGEFLGNLKHYATAIPYIARALELKALSKPLSQRAETDSSLSEEILEDEDEGTRWLAHGLAVAYNALLCRRSVAQEYFHQLSVACNHELDVIAAAFVPYQTLLVETSVPLAVTIAKKAAQDFVDAAQLIPSTLLTPLMPSCSNRKLRIGYVSSDFNRHCIGDLLLHVFQYHKTFEVFAFSTSNIEEDSHQLMFRERVDHFIDISIMSNTEAVSLIRSHRIDVLVDLNGYTQGSRTLIFALRSARLQISWLGYPATSGGEFMDMIVVDPGLIGEREQFTEKLFVMPFTYQANSYRTTYANLTLIPQLGNASDWFDFVNLNRLEKIDEGTLQTWIRILKRVPTARLRLLASPTEAVEEIQKDLKEVESQIIWELPCSPGEHMLRLSRAHVLLDTHLYNSHTSASDALWAGLPVLTFPGPRMHSRVAASLVAAVGCADTMRVASFEEYEERAVDWALNPSTYARVREALHRNRDTCPLFRTDLWVRDFERGLAEVVNQQSHKSLEDFFVPADDG